jgi:hypothetical protein
MEVDPISLFGSAMALIAIIGKHFYYDAALRERVAILEKDSKDMTGACQDIRDIKVKVDLFWKAVENQVPDMLMKGNPIPEDSKLFQLLQKFAARQITKEEIVELGKSLDEEAKNGGHTAGEVLALILLSANVKSKAENGGADIWTYS